MRYRSRVTTSCLATTTIPKQTRRRSRRTAGTARATSGYMDGDGYVYITGRMKSVIVLENGKNVFPEEIEEYLGKIDTICESVVVGRKAPDSDAIILTAVVFLPTTSSRPVRARS